MMIYRAGTLFTLSLLLSGCVDLSPYRQSPAPVEGGYPPVYGKPAPSPRIDSRAATTKPYEDGSAKRHEAAADPLVVALVDDSKASQRQGDLSAAVATLERGVRIRPRNPLLWSQLAELRLKQGKVVLAENLARKSLALIQTDKNRALQSKNWQIIARSLQQQGKAKEAALATHKAGMFR